MDQTERKVIDDLFGKLRQAEEATGPRDADAERHIQAVLRAQPAAPYYMAQAVFVQEHAIAAAQARIQQLEGELASRPAGGAAAAGGGGFLGGLFGGGMLGQGGAAGAGAHGGRGVPPPGTNAGLAQLQRYQQGQGQPQGRPGFGGGGFGGGGGGSFLGGAVQTAMGIAGGLVLGNLLMSAFDGGEALAGEAAGAAEDAAGEATDGLLPGEEETAAAEDAFADDPGAADDAGGDFGDEV